MITLCPFIDNLVWKTIRPHAILCCQGDGYYYDLQMRRLRFRMVSQFLKVSQLEAEQNLNLDLCNRKAFVISSRASECPLFINITLVYAIFVNIIHITINNTSNLSMGILSLKSLNF